MKPLKKIKLLLALFILLSGCSTKPPDSRVTINYLTIETLPEQRWALKQLVKKFEETHPHIRVKVNHSVSGFQKLKIRIAGGDAPDVFYFTSDRMPALVYRNVLLDLSPLIEAEDDLSLDHYFSQVVQTCQIKDKFYLFPFHFSTDLLFYNKDHFNQAQLPYPTSDWTWNDFLASAKKLTRWKNGRIQQFGVIQPRPLLLIRSFGGDLVDQNLQSIQIQSEATKRAFSYLVDLEKKHKVSPPPGWMKDMQKEDGLELFLAGKISMFVGRTYMVSELTKNTSLNWDVERVPKGEKLYSRLAVGGNCISKTTQHPKEAWEFVKFYSGEEGSKICGLSRNCVPALEKVARSSLFLYSPPSQVHHLIDSIKFSKTENYGLLNWDEFFQKCFKVETDKILFGVSSIDKSLGKIKREANLMLKKEQQMRKAHLE